MPDIDKILLTLEAFRAEQREANQKLLYHIMQRQRLAEAWQALEKWVDRIEKHLNLPPVK
jgi:hypothetical protein